MVIFFILPVLVMDRSDLNTIPVPNPAVVSREAPDGGSVMVNCDTGTAVAVNATGTLVWKFIDGRRSPGAIAEAVGSHFGIARETVQADVDALLATLADDGFVGYEIPGTLR